MSVVSVRNLRVVMPGSATAVVDGVSFRIEAGQCLGIVGESGAGKTLTARSLIGLAGPGVSADELTVTGTDARTLSPQAWRGLRGARVGLVSQDALVSLDPLRRVGAEVAEPLEIHEPGLNRAARAQRVLDVLGQVALPDAALRARQYPHELSGGLRQRALIGSALAAGPRLLIADEPTTALDATVQAQIVTLLRQLKESGLALLLISHDLGVMRELADQVAVMRAGRFVEMRPAVDLFADPQHPYTRELLAAAQLGTAAAPVPAPVVLSAVDLAVSFTGRSAVDGVSVELCAGQTVGIVGESGSGKTTVARMLLGIQAPDRGTVLLHGEPWSAVPESRRRGRRGGIQIIHQDSLSAFDPRATVLQILSEAIALDTTVPHRRGPRTSARRRRRARAVELLEQVALTEAMLGRRAHELSGGQRQRVAIARALARRPSILVCDEPVSALDAPVQAQVLALLAHLQASANLAMVFISHDLDVVRALSHEILVMKDGVVVEQGPAAELFAAPRHPFTRELLAAHR